jgi:hypothetical protein
MASEPRSRDAAAGPRDVAAGPPNTPAGSPDAAAPRGLPWPAVAGALAGLLVLMLAAGVLANQYLRPATTIPQPAATAAPPATSATPLSASTPARPVAAAQPTSTLQSAPSQLTVTPQSANAAPQPTVTLVTGTTATAPPPLETPTSVPIVSPTPSPTVDPELAAEVGKAYEHYWEIWGDAFLNLDTSHLDEVMGGDHLRVVQDRIEELRTEGRAVETHVDHNYRVISNYLRLA